MKKFSVKPRLNQTRRLLIGCAADSDEFVFLGRLAEAGPLLRIDFDLQMPHVVAIFGKRGSGKSYTLGSLLEGLCTRNCDTTISKISRTRAALLFDTLGIFQWMDIPLLRNSPQELLRQQSLSQKGWDIQTEPCDIEIWAPRGTESVTRRYGDFTINCSDFSASDWGYLLGVDILQDRMGQLLNDTYEKVVNEGWHSQTADHDSKKQYAIEDLMECVQQDTSSSIMKCNTWGSRKVPANLSIYGKTI